MNSIISDRRSFLQGSFGLVGATALSPVRIDNKKTPLPPIIGDWELYEKPNAPTGKFTSFFIDDVIWCLRDLTRTRPKSAFDVPFFKLLKTAHERYGLKVCLNLFYRTDYFYGTDEFTLAQVTDAYKAEFEAASDWLKFCLHSLQEFPDYPFCNQSYDDLKFVADHIYGEIRRFAGEKSCTYAFEPHWTPISKEGCVALRDCGVKLLSVTHGDRYPYENANQLPYGHGARAENNRKPDVAIFSRGYKELDASLCCYNHLSWEQYNLTAGQFKAIYDRDTKLLYKKFCNTIFLNHYKPDELVAQLKPHLGKTHLVFADHEQYFYPDYFNYQPYYGEMILSAAKYLTENGYTFIFMEDTI